MTFPEFEEMTFLQKILQKSDVFFDIGANMGSWVLVAAGKIKSGHVYAFEPSPFILGNLQENIGLNQLDKKVSIIDQIVSNKNGTEQFVIESIPEINHIAYGNKKGKKLLKHSCIKLDTFMSQQKIKHVDVIKIDVEGAEHKVLEGLRNSLAAHKIGIMIVELNFHTSEFGYSPEDTLELIHSAGYKTYSFNKTGHLEPLEKMDFRNKNILNAIAVSPQARYQSRFKRYQNTI
jgi:FkbM family methyltransferase